MQLLKFALIVSLRSECPNSDSRGSRVFRNLFAVLAHRLCPAGSLPNETCCAPSSLPRRTHGTCIRVCESSFRQETHNFRTGAGAVLVASANPRVELETKEQSSLNEKSPKRNPRSPESLSNQLSPTLVSWHNDQHNDQAQGRELADPCCKYLEQLLRV